MVKRKSRIPMSVRTEVLLRCKGRCEGCGQEFDDLVPDIHHINGNIMNNDLSNLIVLCPNCHRKVKKSSKGLMKPIALSKHAQEKFDLERFLTNINAFNEVSDPQTRFMLLQRIRDQTTDLPYDGMPNDVKNIISELLQILKKEIGDARMIRLCLDILHIVNIKRDTEVNIAMKDLFLSWIEENYNTLSVEEKSYALNIRQRLYEYNLGLMRELMLSSINEWSSEEFEKLHLQIEFDRLDKNCIDEFKVLLWKLRDEANKKQLNEKVQRIDKLLGLYIFQ